MSRLDAPKWGMSTLESCLCMRTLGVYLMSLKFRHSRLLPAGISAVASDDHNADGIPQR